MSERPRWHVEGRDWPNRDASRFVDAGGIRFHVQIAGTGPALLLLHGTGAATHSWRDLMPLLEPHFTVVAPDLPGHGFTDPIAAPTLDAVTRRIAALLDAIDMRPALIVGHSAGAAIAVQLARSGEGNVPIIALNGALLPFPGLAARLFPALAKLLFVNPLMPRLFALRARTPGEVPAFLARSTGSAIDARGADLYARLARTPGHCAGALAMMANWNLEPLADALPVLASPLWLIHGSRDAAIPPSVSRTVAATVPHGEAIMLDGLGHLAHEEAPARVADHVVRIARDHGILPPGEE